MTDLNSVTVPSPVRLRIDGGALVSNYQALAKASGAAATGAAVKANGYGVGAREVVSRLSKAGCRDFFVAHWSEAVGIADIIPAEQITVLNGVAAADLPLALSLGARPMLNSPEQIQRWRQVGGGRCHVMIDSGINRLGIGPEQIGDGLFNGLDIDILASHLASADEDALQNGEQLAIFHNVAANVRAGRLSFANSAGIMLGSDYHFDLTRPGLSLYGGIARTEMASLIKQVVFPEAQVLQIRNMPAGSPIGYNATYRCVADKRVATVSLGYADGYLRAFSGRGLASFEGQSLLVIGRVSMDLITLDADNATNLREGDWVSIDYALPEASRQSGLSQYELLTGLNSRFDRQWI
jgi:alanine racemase